MVLEVALIDVTPGEEDAFAAAYLDARTVLATTPGCRNVRMTRGIESPSRFVLLVEWDSVEAHLDNFRNTERFGQWRGRSAPTSRSRRASSTSPTYRPDPMMLRAADGTPIDAYHDPGPDQDLAVVVAHGFTGSWQRPALRQVATVLSGRFGVVSFDFRGHGRSGGASTVGDREVLDLGAAIAWARELGYARVATLGFSMGASVVVRHGGLHGGLAAVVAVSGPSRWYYRGTVAMRRVHWVIEQPLGRLVSRVALRTRIDPAGWTRCRSRRDALAARIAPTPLLIVHGDADHYFPVEHAEALYAAAARAQGAVARAGLRATPRTPPARSW